MLREDIFGTIGTAVFDLAAFAIIFILWTVEAPKALAVAGTVVLGGVALWATVKVCIYWFNKIKKKWNSKRKQ